MSVDGIDPPEGVNHYEDIQDLPRHIRKYWHQRYKIFSKWDQGIWLTDDAWFGVTPEPIANKIAEHISDATPESKTVLIDAFAGAGGNAIAFALSGRWKQIFAIERDPKTLACAKHNAKIYGVERKIWWIEGDCFDVLQKRMKAVQKEAIVFASPPWGGPSYTDADVFSLAGMEPYSLRDLHTAFVGFSRHVVLFLPRTSDLNEIAALTVSEDNGQGGVHADKPTSVIHYCMYGSSKALCVYYGDFTFDQAITDEPDE